MEGPTLALQQYVKEEIGNAVKNLQADILEAVGNSLNEWEKKQATNTYNPSKLDKIGHYLRLLYEAQQVNHAVHAEIDEALKQFKQEAGI